MYSKAGDKRRGLMLRLGIMAAMAMVAVITLFGSGAQGALAVGAQTVQFQGSAGIVAEGGTICVYVTRTGDTSATNDVSYNVAGDTSAIRGYAGTISGAATFPAGQTSVPLITSGGTCFTAAANPGMNADRYITFTLTNAGTNGTLGTPTVFTLTITDDTSAGTLSFSNTAPTGAEGATVSVPVVRTGGSVGAVTTTCTVATGGSANSSDYTIVGNPTISWAAGDSTSVKYCQYYLVPDGSPEGPQTMNLALSGYASTAVLTITDTSGAGFGTVSFQSPSYSGSETAGQSIISLTRTGSTSGSVTVYCVTIAGGTATPNVDYSSGSYLATFANGVSTATCAIPLVNDVTPDSGETVALQLQSVSSGGTIGSQQTATLTIYDNSSGLGTVQFASASYVGYENSGAAVIGLTRTISAAGLVTVYCQTLPGGTATAGVDYTAGSYPAVFANGATTATCSIPITNDGVSEPLGETVTLGLTDISAGASYGSQQIATLTILDGNGTGVTVTSLSPNYGPTSGGNTVTITGTNLINATSVTFGGFSAGISYNNGSQITVTAPFHTAGTVEVVVNTPQGSNSTVGTANDYTYTDGPTITNVNPNTGPASGAPTTFVTITGANFIIGGGGMTVEFGGTATANFNVTDVNTIIVIAPAHTAGTVDIVVTTPGGSSPISVNDQFTYTGSSAPVVSSVSPSSGATGIVVTITGSGFTGVICPAGVTFGGVAAASCTVNSDTSITATVPTNTPSGVSDVRVTNAIGMSANTVADNFNNTSATGATITYNLVSKFTLIGWSGIDNISAAAALKGQENPDNPATNNVYGVVTVIWRFDSATQSYKGYFPGSENVPGANDFTTLQKGVGYFVAINVSSVSWTVLEG